MITLVSLKKKKMMMMMTGGKNANRINDGTMVPSVPPLGTQNGSSKKKWKQQSRNGEGANTRVGKYDLEKKKRKDGTRNPLQQEVHHRR